MSGNMKDAISIYEMMVEMMESKLGTDHPETLIGKSNLLSPTTTLEDLRTNFEFLKLHSDR